MKFAFVTAAALLVLACSRENAATDTATHTAIAAPDTSATTAPPPTTTTASETVAGGAGTLPPHAIVAPTSTATASIPPEQVQKTQETPPQVTNYVAIGQRLYRENCAGCHGEDASGKTPVGQRVGMPDLKSAQVQSKTDDQLANAIVNGTGAMSNKAHQSKRWDPDQLTGLLAYVRSLK